jgi:chromosome segregation ATPase
LDSNQQANQEQNSRLQLVSEIIKASRKKLIPEVCGRLGDLATIDS